MGETLKGFEPIYGTIQGQIEEATFQEQYPFLFCLRAKDDTHLQFFTTDFHSNTWLVEKSIGELEELRDDVGVGESWEDFIGYMRDAFASGNVKMVLGGPMGSRGHASAKVRAQKVKGTPRIDLKLSKLEGNAAHDIMGAIVNSLFKVFQACSSALSAENAHVAYLSAALADEKARADRMQQQIDTANFSGRRKQRAALTLPDLPPTGTFSGEKLPLRNATLPTAQTGIPEAGKAEKVVSKHAHLGPRVYAAPSARRGRRMGTVISTGEVDDDKI